MTTIYGIRNCDTMKRAIAWLRDQNVEHEFHDYKRSGIDPKLLSLWSAQTGWEALLNTRGTTWRKLSEEQRANMSGEKAIELMCQQPSLIKRPVLVHGGKILVGFDEQAYRIFFGK
jgi:arsenate reductase